MANKNKKVLIAGGGIGGITALLALRRRGIAAELFEQAAAFGQVGAGLQVSGNATRILRTLGLGAALAQASASKIGESVMTIIGSKKADTVPEGPMASSQRSGML